MSWIDFGLEKEAPLPPLKLENIRTVFDHMTLIKGYNYMMEDRILFWDCKSLDEEFWELSGDVAGSGENIYEVFVTIDTSSSSPKIMTYCNCPVGEKCKHAAALCLEYIEKLSEEEPSISKPVLRRKEADFHGWIDTLESEVRSAGTEGSRRTRNDAPEFLIYRYGRRKDRLHLDFLQGKYLKKGGISKGKRLDPSDLTRGYRYRTIVGPEDEKILRLARAFLDSGYYSSDLDPIADEIGYELVRRSLETGRAFWEEERREPLHFDATTFPISFSFSREESAWRPRPDFDTERYFVAPTVPTLVFDTLEHRVHPAELSSGLYYRLLYAPPIHEDELPEAFVRLRRVVPDLVLNLPGEVEHRLLEVPLRPRLRLYRGEGGSSALALDFLYDDVMVGWSPRQGSVYRMEEGRVLEIRRDLAGESRAREELEAMGFELKESEGVLRAQLRGDPRERQRRVATWKRLLEEIETLESDGWMIERAEDFDLVFEPETAQVVVQSEESSGWFELGFMLEFGGRSAPLAPLVTQILEEFDDPRSLPPRLHLEVEPNRFVDVEGPRIRPVLETILELFSAREQVPGADESIRIAPYEAHLLAFDEGAVTWKGPKELLELSERLRHFDGLEPVEPPRMLQAQLRPYQLQGLSWLDFLHRFRFGGILADDMGLGKTIQTLAHLARLKEQGRLDGPALVVVPTSLVANWKAEAERFTPGLRLMSYYGPEREALLERHEDYDLIVTTYTLVVRDLERLSALNYDTIVLDEAQKIKNHKTKMAQALKSLRSHHRLALSGTPIENHLGELWSIFSFLMPGFLDTLSFFRRYYQIPIEKEHDRSRQEALNRRIRPFVLRRTKEKVATELPPKTEIVKYTQFGPAQARLYESIRVTMEDKVREAVRKKGLASSQIMILDALLKLRQVCCDPSLLKIEAAQKVKASAKRELFLELVEELLAEGRRILVFSQFTSMLSILEKELQKRRISTSKLTGATRKRQEAIERFTRGDAEVFLISLKAGGVGLNLVEADTVIHYDPWWNPAVENQATDRAYRIGQEKAVFVYKLIVENSIEQKILELQEKKRSLQNALYAEKEGEETLRFSGEELLELLR